MSVAETWTPSRRLKAAAAAERERIARELARLRARERELQAELATLDGARTELERQLDVLDQFSGDPDAAPPVADRPRLRAVTEAQTASVGTPLRGAQIREIAVRVLADAAPPGAPVHYRDWFQLLAARGFTPAGKDPLATFLTQIGRSPLVQRSTSSGIYALDLEFPDRARARLAQLTAQLSDSQELAPDATVQDIAAARERRDQLTAEIHDVERQLEEVRRSLGGSDA